MSRFCRPVLVLAALAAVGLAIACSDTSRGVAPAAPSFSANEGNGHAYAFGHYHVLACSARAAHQDSAVIGAAGGVLRIGPDRLVVPAGALDAATLLTGQVLPVDVVNIEFGPEGLQFEIPAQLTLNTGGCQIPAGATPSIVYVQNGQIIEVIPSVFDQVHHKITGPIHHFSGYSVAFMDGE